MGKQFTIIIPDTDSPRIGEVLKGIQDQNAGLAEGEVLVVGSDRPGLVREDAIVRFIPTGAETRCASDRRNLGMELAQGDVFLFLDDDCIPEQGWLQQHLERQARGDPVVGGAVRLARRNYFQLADNLSAFHELLPYTRAGRRRYLCTSNLSVQRWVVEQVGGMPPERNRADDLEWTARMSRAGIRLEFEPQAVVLHDPDRCTLDAVWRHWQVDAPDTLRTRLQYAAELGTPRMARFRGMYRWGSPLVAAWATLRTFAHLSTLLHYGHTLPLVYLTKLIWCWSAYRNFPK